MYVYNKHQLLKKHPIFLKYRLTQTLNFKFMYVQKTCKWAIVSLSMFCLGANSKRQVVDDSLSNSAAQELLVNMNLVNASAGSSQIYGLKVVHGKAVFFNQMQPTLDQDLLVMTQALQSLPTQVHMGEPVLREIMEYNDYHEQIMQIKERYSEHISQTLALIDQFDQAMCYEFGQLIDEKAFDLFNQFYALHNERRSYDESKTISERYKTATLSEQQLKVACNFYRTFPWHVFLSEIKSYFYKDLYCTEEAKMAYYDSVWQLMNAIRDEEMFMLFLKVEAKMRKEAEQTAGKRDDLSAQDQKSIILIDGVSYERDQIPIHAILAVFGGYSSKMISFQNAFDKRYIVLSDCLQNSNQILMFVNNDAVLSKFLIEHFGYDACGYLKEHGMCYCADGKDGAGVYSRGGKFVTQVLMPENSASYFFTHNYSYPGGDLALVKHHLPQWKWYEKQLIDTLARVDEWKWRENEDKGVQIMLQGISAKN